MQEPIEFALGGRTFRIGAMDAMTQQHVARRVQPIFVAAIPAILAALPGGKIEPGALLNLDMSVMTSALGTPAEMLAKMPDDQYEYIQARCLACVEVQKSGGAGWAPIWSAGANRLMFDDIEAHDLVGITFRVLAGRIGPFFQGLLFAFIEQPRA